MEKYRPTETQREHQLNRPKIIFQQVVENKRIFESVVTPHGNEQTRIQIKKAFEVFNREESTNAAQLFIETMANEKEDRLQAARVLFSHINLLKVDPERFDESYNNALSKQQKTRNSSENIAALREAKKSFEEVRISFPKNKSKSNYTEKRQKKILSLIQENPLITSRELAEKTNVHIRTIIKDKKILKSNGEEIISKAGRRRNPEIAKRRNKIQAALESNPNLTNRDLANLIGCRKADIENDLAQMRQDGRVPAYSYTQKEPSIKIQKRRERVKQHLANGKSFEQIAEEEQCSSRTAKRDAEWLEKQKKQK